jgi:DNA mismatch repair protein PMS2
MLELTSSVSASFVPSTHASAPMIFSYLTRNTDVRFKNQGLDLIEVQDNGAGISPANYASVALKHHTSKLSSYADIGSLMTFGFRGEALASLCALSILTIVTCQAEDVPKGSKLSFEPSGKLSNTSLVAAQRGTTVSVEKLFHNLPVRRRELERNIKREWQKVISLLNQYACIQTNLKFTVSQQPTKGKRIVLFSTKGNATTRDNVINIFGAKTMAALVPLELSLEMQPSTLAPALQASVDTRSSVSKDVRIVGHVSRPMHGEGRQAPDRQMFFVNGRPCGLPQFAKMFNEVYRAYNSSQSPFILADIQLDTHMYDVNVSPDKRTILLHDQNQLLDTIRKALIEIFDSQDYSVPTSQLLKYKQATLGNRTAAEVSKASSSRQLETEERESASSSPPADEEPGVQEDKPRNTVNTLSKGGRLRKWLQNPSEAPSEVPRELSKDPQDSDPDTDVGGITTRSSSEHATSNISDNEDHGSEALAPARSARPLKLQNNDRPALVGDFNDRLAEHGAALSKPRIQGSQHLNKSAGKSTSSPPGSEIRTATIPSVQPLKSGGLCESVLVQRSPSRTAAFRPATSIMIGDSGVASVSDESSEASEQDESAVPSPTHEKPTFGTRLSNLFRAGDSAPNTAMKTKLGGTGHNSSHPAMIPINITRESTPELAVATDVNENALLLDDAPSLDEKLASEDDADESSVNNETATPQSRAPSIQAVTRRKEPTARLVHNLSLLEDSLQLKFADWLQQMPRQKGPRSSARQAEDITAADAESKLSLYISKADFAQMRVVGQFNLGFIIAVRPAQESNAESHESDNDELFIIDQHASDEKFNFERLQEKTVVQSQRLVHPKQLELTALEEEVVMENLTAIEANGFQISINTDGEYPVGSRCHLMALPLSRETTFDLKDLEELISLLGESSSESSHVPRPSKVRKMFASRACRSSVMIGKALTRGQMYSLVGHMGELDKPWNCPHGRPTMRHLYRMRTWDEKGWSGDLNDLSASDWRDYSQK